MYVFGLKSLTADYEERARKRLLKQKSIDCASIWRNHGKPRSGPVFHCMRDCSFKYKHAIRKAKRDYEAQKDDELSDNLITRDSASF